MYRVDLIGWDPSKTKHDFQDVHALSEMSGLVMNFENISKISGKYGLFKKSQGNVRNCHQPYRKREENSTQGPLLSGHCFFKEHGTAKK